MKIAKPQNFFDYIMIFIFLFFVVFALRYQVKLLYYIDWGDESETVVVTKMIAAGYSLYSQIFNHHGPLVFLPGVFIEKLGDFGVAAHRIPIMILQILAMISLYCCPLLKDRFTKILYTVTATSIMLLYFPDMFGHTYMYQVITGLFLVIIIAQYTLPAIVCPERISAKNIITGNILIASMAFLAVTYAPATLLLFLASLRKRFFKQSVIAFAVGILINILWLISIGSIPGYLAYHIYLNAVILPLYNGGQSFHQLLSYAFYGLTQDLTQFSILAILVAAIARLAAYEERFPWRSMLLSLGIGSLLIRSIGFHALPYFYAFLAIPLMLFKDITVVGRSPQIIGMVFAVICMIRVSLVLGGDQQKLEGRQIPVSSGFAQLAQLVTHKNDRIIAYSFQNDQYILADRLPASGNFFYLPWQEKYNAHPKLGISISSCKDIATYRPKLMLIDKWKVWGSFSWDSYAGCVQKLMDKFYVEFPGQPWYLRKDIILNEKYFGDSKDAPKIMPSAVLTTHHPIILLMPASPRGVGLKRIGIKFGTYGRKNKGEAMLYLEGPQGAKFTQKFALPAVADNDFYYFTLDSKSYTRGKIVALSGGGVSAWESHLDKEKVYTCINYLYADGKFSVTPGCIF